MRALTLTQPWATLVAYGVKRIETRSWPTNYGGPLAIHAAASMPRFAQEFLSDDVCLRALAGAGALDHPMPRGAVVAVCTLVGCYRIGEDAAGWPVLAGDPPERYVSEAEEPWGNYDSGRYAWVLEDVRRLEVPQPAKGQLGLWEWRAPADLGLAAAGGAR